MKILWQYSIIPCGNEPTPDDYLEIEFQQVQEDGDIVPLQRFQFGVEVLPCFEPINYIERDPFEVLNQCLALWNQAKDRKYVVDNVGILIDALEPHKDSILLNWHEEQEEKVFSEVERLRHLISLKERAVAHHYRNFRSYCEKLNKPQTEKSY